MATIEVNYPSTEQPGRVKKLRVDKDAVVFAGRILLLYNCINTDDTATASEKKLRATQFGRVTEILVKEGDTVQPGQVVLLMEAGCKHPTVMKDLCAECGADLRQAAENDGKDISITEASVAMVHSVPELKVCPELAEKIGKEDKQRLLTDRKLVLLVDLDQTIVHTTNDNVPAVMKDVFHHQLYGPNSPWYHTKLRPGTQHFLAEMSKIYELHICTFGARNYAHAVAGLLDREGKLFSHRILSRDECFNPLSKTANLKALFPCGDELVCIIDDREDVWQGCGNLVQVKPYNFFRHTGDINAPPGLERRDPPEFVAAQIDEDPAAPRDVENGIEKPQEQSEVVEKVEEPVYVQQPEPNDSDSKTEVAKKKTDNLDDDYDDYLLYLEDILRRIHTEFYCQVDEGDMKPLREIIPQVRARVLKGLHLTFSGLIPTHQKLYQSRAYRVAKAFGANVSQDITEHTTHLVAIKPGTAKANAARKNSNIKIVNPDWLWSCAERWEHVDERLFPLTAKARGSRIPPPHCSSPERVEVRECQSENFANSINPLMSFTQEEIANMDKEVDEDMTDAELDGSMDKEELGTVILSDSDDSSELNAEDDEPSIKRAKIVQEDFPEDDDDDDPVTRFRRGETLIDEFDLGENGSQDVPEVDDPLEEDDDREWNAMGAALEREFLSD